MAIDEEQIRCAASGHAHWVIATRTITIYDGMIPIKKRVRYCTGCGLDNPSSRPKDLRKESA